MSNSACKVNQIHELEEHINELYKDMPIYKDVNFFLDEDSYNLENPSNELTFQNIIFYLYKIYFERAELNLEFVIQFSHLIKIEQEMILKHKKVIHAFRTKLGHYLDNSKKHDQQISQRCSLWYYSSISKSSPEDDIDWSFCVSTILGEAQSALENVFNIMQKIIYLNDQIIYEQWEVKQSHNIPKYRRIEIIEEIKKHYDYKFDVNIMYQKYQKKFDSAISLIDLSNKKKFEESVFLHYEKIILGIDIFPCPLSGKEVGEKFHILGKDLSILMKKVNEYYSSNPHMSKEDLYSYIEKYNLRGLE